MAVLLADTRIVMVNQHLCDMLGYTEEELLGLTFEALSYAEELDTSRSIRSEMVGGDRSSAAVEKHYRRKDGSAMWASVAAAVVRDAEDQPLYFVATLIDIGEEKRAQQALRDNRHWLEESQRVAGLGHYVYDIQKDSWDGSPMLYEVLGISEDYKRDFAGWLQTVHPLARDAMSRYFAEEVLGKREPFDREYRVLRPSDGAERWVHGSGTAEWSEVGQPTSMFGVIEDITERKAAEDELRLKNAVFNASIEAHSAADVAGNLTEVNDSFLEMWGYPSRDEVIGRPIPDFLQFEEEAAAILASLNASGKWEGEYTGRRKDGTTFAAYGMATDLKDATGKLVGYQSEVLDITERKRAEEEQLFFASLYEHMREGVYLLRAADGIIVSTNPVFDDMFGYAPGELFGQPVSILNASTDKDPEETANEIMTDLKRTGSWVGEVLNQRKDGTPFWCEAVASTFEHPNHGTVWLCLHRDITERKRREAYGYLARTVLAIMNEPTREGESLQRVVAALKAGTGFDAVGIRLQDGEDFPYVAQEGYSPEHLLTENTLMARDEAGEALRDECGNVILECTCGLVLSDRGDPLLSAGGSFWTSDSYPLLDLPRAEDPRVNPRNLCILERFASVALVPIRDGERILGLIHLSDRRKDCFDAENVELLEGIALHVGEAVSRKAGEERLARSLAATIRVASLLSESRDPYTAGHQRRVSELSVAIARKMGMSEEEVDQVGTTALLHDVGKMSIPAEILSKPGKLSPVEFELIKSHSEAGHAIVKGADLESPIADVILQHHERLDGSGYPRGLSADQILLGARIIMVADVVEAMSSHRPYRPALGVDAALAEIEDGAGVRYDAAVVKACGEVFGEDAFAFSA